MYLMWNALAEYTLDRGIEVLFGVASFHGTDVARLAAPLSLLHHRHLAPVDLRVRALPEHFLDLNLMPEAKIDKVTVDTSSAKTDPITVETTIDATVTAQQAKKAADAAQDEANRSGNVIEFKTRIDRDELQRQVNRAAASITPPTITVRTKVQKEVP